MEVIIVPFKKNITLVKISNFFLKYFPIPVGDLDQQWTALKMHKKYDLIYSPCQTQTYIDMDHEKEGIGFWANPDDVESSKKIISKNWDNVDAIKEMGRKGRELAESEKNSDTFNKEIYALIKSISLKNGLD